MKFLSLLASLCLIIAVKAEQYKMNELFVITLYGDGYDDKLENQAWDAIVGVFMKSFPLSFQTIVEGGKRRALVKEDLDQLEKEATEEGTRQLLTTCPKNCLDTYSAAKCKYLCGGGGGRRLGAASKTFVFNKGQINKSMRAILDDFEANNPGVTMNAAIDV